MSSTSPYCVAIDNVSGCSGFDELTLPGLNNLPPYTFTVSTLPPGTKRALYVLVITEARDSGELYAGVSGASGP